MKDMEVEATSYFLKYKKQKVCVLQILNRLDSKVCRMDMVTPLVNDSQ